MQNIIKAAQNAAIKIAAALKNSDGSYAQSTNATGDSQLKLDILSDDIITKELTSIASVKALVSEEKEDALAINAGGRYIVAYDPLDGSSLVDVDFAVGSIFGVYEEALDIKRLKAAFYFIYGPRLECVICTGTAPVLYRLNDAGEFVRARELKLEKKGKLLAPGGTQKGWPAWHKNMIERLFSEGYRLRYSGAMVSDLHQILLKGGGLFSYPAGAGYEAGKLRLAFEVAPFAFIYENAGGMAVSGPFSRVGGEDCAHDKDAAHGKNASQNARILSLVLSSPHQTTPCYLGSEYEVLAASEMAK